METRIEKVNETTYRRFKVTPAVPAIPEIVEPEEVSLSSVQKELEEVNAEIARKEASKADTLKQKEEKVADRIAYYDQFIKQDEDVITELTAKKIKLEAEITEAKGQGVVSEKEIVENTPRELPAAQTDIKS